MPSMSERERLIREAFTALDAGDAGPLKRLFDQDATWVAIPQGRAAEDTPACPDRTAMIRRLRRHRANGRAFQVGDVIERGDRLAVAMTITDPGWSLPVETYKVFTFRPGGDVVVRLNDCLDESYALQVLVA
jgi:ketosteroid isomerase-like protein